MPKLGLRFGACLKQGQTGSKDRPCTQNVDDIEGRTRKEPGIGAPKLQHKAPQGVPNEIAQNKGAGLGLSAGNLTDDDKAQQIPEGFVKKQRLKARAIGIGFEIVEGWNAVLRVNTEAPGQGCRGAVELLVNKVSESTDGLGQGQPEGNAIEINQRR